MNYFLEYFKYKKMSENYLSKLTKFWIKTKTLLTFEHEDEWMLDYEKCKQNMDWYCKGKLGIFMWSKPLVTKDLDGRDLAIVLMRVAGWYDYSPESTMIIFAMSTVLSTIQGMWIYVCNNLIDHNIFNSNQQSRIHI